MLAAVPRGFWVLADQGIVSVTNFAAGVAVGRLCGAAELGAYWLGFGAMMFAYAIAKAVVWTPYTATVPHLAGDERRAYSGSVTLHLLMIGAGASLVCLIAAAVCWLAMPESLYAPLLLCLAVAAPLWLLREHVRRLCLGRLRVIEVLLFDIAASLLQAAAIAAIVFGGVLSGGTVLMAIGASALAVLAWFAWRRNDFLFSHAKTQSDWQRTWPFARWLAGGAACVQGGEQGMRWLVPGLYSLAAAGQLAAGQQIIQLLNPLVIGVSNYFGPVSANVFGDQGLAGLWRHTVRGTLWLMGCGAAALVALVTAGPILASPIYGAEITGVNSLLVASLALGTLSTVIHVPIEFASIARSRGQLLFYTAILRLAINATLGVALIYWLGPLGVGFGLLAGNVVSLAIQWASLAREIRHA